MKIIESSIIGKKSPEACEDGMVVTDDFIAVIDGSTSKTPKHLNPDMKNGRYAMMLISEYIWEELKADASVDDFCQGVTAYIYNKVYEKLGVEERLKEHPEERLTASAILYSRTRNEVWMVGDCQAIIDGKLYENGKPYEQEIARKRVELIEQGLSPAEARKQIEPLLIKAMLSGQNQTYTVIDGFPIYREGVKVVSVSASSSVQDSVPASDSVPCSDSAFCIRYNSIFFLRDCIGERWISVPEANLGSERGGIGRADSQRPSEHPFLYRHQGHRRGQ
ncbi:hypothetical protein [Segatella copri]|uniref:hypothetical protein n=1 Tax=Segatella copri TaxID=165179 RepID=UPI002FEF6A9E